jgi:hypothetical protein
MLDEGRWVKFDCVIAIKCSSTYMTWFLTKATVMGDEASIVVLKIYNNVGYPSKSNARFVREAIE